jgi:hypothetical protein
MSARLTRAARDGSLHKTLEKNGVPLKPSISIGGNMLTPGEPAAASKAKGRLSAGAVAGIVIGSVLGVVLLAVLVLGLLLRRSKRGDRKASGKAVRQSPRQALLPASPGSKSTNSAAAAAPATKPHTAGAVTVTATAGAAAVTCAASTAKVDKPAQVPAPVAVVPVQPPVPQPPAYSGPQPKNLMQRFATWTHGPEVLTTGTAAAAGGTNTVRATPAKGSATFYARSAVQQVAGQEERDARRRWRFESYEDDAATGKDKEARLLSGVPRLEGHSSLSKGVHKERTLRAAKLGITGVLAGVCVRGGTCAVSACTHGLSVRTNTPAAACTHHTCTHHTCTRTTHDAHHRQSQVLRHTQQQQTGWKAQQDSHAVQRHSCCRRSHWCACRA